MILTLFYLGWFLVLAGWIWLVILGFKKSALWGILNLIFSPVAAIVFSIKFKEWFPFVIYMLGLIMAAISMRLVISPTLF